MKLDMIFTWILSIFQVWKLPQFLAIQVIFLCFSRLKQYLHFSKINTKHTHNIHWPHTRKIRSWFTLTISKWNNEFEITVGHSIRLKTKSHPLKVWIQIQQPQGSQILIFRINYFVVNLWAIFGRQMIFVYKHNDVCYMYNGIGYLVSISDKKNLKHFRLKIKISKD